jgi:hypothetical protein
MGKQAATHRQRIVRVDPPCILIQNLKHTFDIRLETPWMELHVRVRRLRRWIQQNPQQHDVDLMVIRPSGFVDLVAVLDRLFNVTQNLNVDCQYLLVLSKLSQHNRALLKQIVVGKVDQNLVSGELVRGLEKVDEFLTNLRELALFRLKLFRVRIRLQLKDLLFVLSDQDVVEQRLCLHPHVDDVLEIGNHQRLVRLEQEIEYVCSRQVLNFQDVFSENLQTFLGMLLQNPIGELEDDFLVLSAEVLEILDCPIVFEEVRSLEEGQSAFVLAWG